EVFDMSGGTPRHAALAARVTRALGAALGARCEVTDYVLVSQSTPRIEHYRRQPDGAWLYHSADAGGRIHLSNGATLAVDEIFAGALEISGE
ncbi:MAG TPA: hypothetical protein VF395_14140, partial [Polyangiaceae bacterium]